MPITSIQYDNTAAEMLYRLGQKQHELNVAQQKNDMMIMQQKLELLDKINPAALSDKLDSDVVNAGIGELKNSVYGYLRQNPNASVYELQNQIQESLSGIAQWSSKVKSIKQNLDEQFKNLPQDLRVNKSSWMAAAKTAALFKKDQNGQFVLRNLNELDDTHDYASELFDRDGETFIDITGIQKDVTQQLTSAPKVKKDIVVQVNASKKAPGFKKQMTVEIPAFAEWDDQANRLRVKTGGGIIDNDIYTQFAGGPDRDKWVSMMVKNAAKDKGAEMFTRAGVRPEDVFAADGSIADQAAFDKLKRAWTVNYLEKSSPFTEAEKDIKMPQITNIYQGGGGSGGDSKKGVTSEQRTWLDEVDAAWASGDVNKLKSLLNRLSVGGKLRGIKTNGNIIEVQSQKFDDATGRIIPNTIQIDVSNDENKGVFTGLYQTLMGADANFEKEAFRRVSAGKSGGSKQTVTKDQFRAMSIAQRQEFLSKGGTVK